MKTHAQLRTKIALCCTMLVLVLARVASAVTYTVGTTTDFAITTVTAANGQIISGPGAGLVTLRSAVIAANMSGVGPHTINVPTGTYNLSVNNPNTPATTATVTNPDLQVGSHGSTISIIGTGGTASKIVQTNQTNAFYGGTGNDVITTGFKSDGFTPAIVNLTLSNLEITGGGFTGIFVGADDGTTRSSTTIINCNIHDNTNNNTVNASFGQGGAIFNQTGSLSISGTTFTNNSAPNTTFGQGGAIYYNLANASGTGATGSFSVTNCTFTTNTSSIKNGFPGGGAIFIAVGSSDALGGAVTITSCTFNGNKANGGGDGGAIAVANTARTTNITKNTFISNQALSTTGRGGAIDMNGGPANINFNRFVTNSATTATNGQTIFHANADAVNADDNWWTVNTGPAVNQITGTAVTATKWLQLKLVASPTAVNAGGTSALTASFLSDSASGAIAAGNLTALVGLPITFGGGSFGTTSGGNTTIQATGTAATTFTAGATAGGSSTSAVVDSATANATVTVQPTVTLNTAALPITATTMTIGGTGFSTTAANNVVTFSGGTTGTVTTATTTQLTVTSLAGLSSGILSASVTTNGISSGAVVQVAVVITAPVVTTPTAASITASTASLGGNVTSNGGGTLSARGVVYAKTSLNSNPQIGGANVTVVNDAATTTGIFSDAATGLTPATQYSFVAFATNAAGTTYTSPVATFTTQSNNADLAALTLSSGSLSPTFLNTTTIYTATVSNTTASITVTPTKADANAAIAVQVNGGTFTTVASGTASGSLSLNVGANTVNVRVTAQDTTQKIYSITVTRRTVFQDWALTNGVPSDPTTIGKDGLTNLVNFAFGLSPTSSLSGALVFNGNFTSGGTIGRTGTPITRYEPIAGGTDYRALFVRRKDYNAAGLTYTVQFSATLSGWTPSAVVPTVLADDGVNQIVSVPYPAVVVATNKGFFQVKVTLAP